MGRDKGDLPGLIGPGRRAFRALIFEAQAMQQLQTARMSVNHRPGRPRYRPPPLPCRASAVRSAELKAPPLAPGSNNRTAPARRTASSRPGRQPRWPDLAALEPCSHRVVVEVQRRRDPGAIPAIVKQQDRVRPARHTVALARAPHHCPQGRAVLRAWKSTPSQAQEESIQSKMTRTFSGSGSELGILKVQFTNCMYRHPISPLVRRPPRGSSRSASSPAGAASGPGSGADMARLGQRRLEDVPQPLMGIRPVRPRF